LPICGWTFVVSYQNIGIDGNNLYDGAGAIIGFVIDAVPSWGAERHAVVFVSVTEIIGGDVYDTAGDVIGEISVRTGVDEADILVADAWISVKDGAQLAVTLADIGFDVSQTTLAGGSCTVKCAFIEQFTAAQKEKFPEKPAPWGGYSLGECLGACGPFSEVADWLLDGVAAILEGNACGHVDIVADLLSAPSGVDLGSNPALFSGTLKGACDAMQCAGIAAPSLANAVRDGLDPKQILVDLDEAIVAASDSDCTAYKTVVDGIISVCSGEAGCTGCQSALDELESDFATASLDCAGSCIGELTELDEAVADLFAQE
jgi:hypothetical protein